MDSPKEVRAAVFDLGGVVVDIDFGRALAHWATRSRSGEAHVRRAFSADEPYRRHETGHLHAEDYFAHLRDTLHLECDSGFIHEGWNAIFLGEIAETNALIDSLAARLPCYALSNTNAAHLAHMQRAFPRMLARFRRVFVSHEIGHRKPHPEAFAHVVREIGCAPGHVLFFDDLEENVAAASRVGLQAVQVRSPADVREALASRGLV